MLIKRKRLIPRQAVHQLRLKDERQPTTSFRCNSTADMQICIHDKTCCRFDEWIDENGRAENGVEDEDDIQKTGFKTGRVDRCDGGPFGLRL
jgi:hypothetical protein